MDRSVYSVREKWTVLSAPGSEPGQEQVRGRERPRDAAERRCQRIDHTAVEGGEPVSGRIVDVEVRRPGERIGREPSDTPDRERCRKRTVTAYEVTLQTAL